MIRGQQQYPQIYVIDVSALWRNIPTIASQICPFEYRYGLLRSPEYGTPYNSFEYGVPIRYHSEQINISTFNALILVC